MTSFRSPRRFAPNSWLTTSAFSGWCFHMSCVVMWVKPMPSLTATPPHGSPTQKPSMLPTFMLATIWAGGIVMILTAFWLMPGGGQPVAQPHVVGATGEGHREGGFLLALHAPR